MLERLECSYGEVGIGKELSNLYPRQFVFQKKEFGSMEGFLQSLKNEDKGISKFLSGLSGIQAWREGQKYNTWKDYQKLYFDGKTYDRNSPEYDTLITSSYTALFIADENFRAALKSSKPFVLSHDIGKMNASDTVLTRFEYLYQLERLRANL